MTSTIEKWSVHHLKTIVDYLDDASLLQVTQTALNMATPEEVASHFTSFLGNEPRAYTFIAEFNARRFPPTTKASVPSKRAENLVRPGSRQDTPERKPDVKIASRKPIGNTTMTSDLGTNHPPPKPQKVKKVDALSEIDAALRDLELTSQTDKKASLVCDCAARRHGLNTVSPNCLSCGKIICTVESYATCGFCHADLLTRNTRDAIIAELKRERGVESAASKQQRKKVTAGSGHRMPYANKLGAGEASSHRARMDEEEVRAATEAANRRKEELLAHVESGYRRTVIDQASDFTAQAADKWSSPAERALALRRAQAAMHADTERGRVISLDLSGGKATIKNEKRARRTEEEVDAGILKEQRRLDEESRREAEAQDAVNQSHTRDKLMGKLGKLTFSATASGETQMETQDWWTRGQRGWNRVQDYNEEEGRETTNEDLVVSSLALDGQPGREEEFGRSKRG